MVDLIFLVVVGAATIDYRNFAEGRCSFIPKVEKWEAELSKDQSAAILKYKGKVVNVRCHSVRFLSWDKQRFFI